MSKWLFFFKETLRKASCLQWMLMYWLTITEKMTRIEKIWYEQSFEKQQKMLLHMKFIVHKKVKKHYEFDFTDLQIKHSIKNFMNDLFNELNFDIKTYYKRIDLILNKIDRRHNNMISMFYEKQVIWLT